MEINLMFFVSIPWSFLREEMQEIHLIPGERKEIIRIKEVPTYFNIFIKKKQK